MSAETPPPNFQSYVPEIHDSSIWAERINLLDKIAKKNDRWWFIALLVIGMIYMGYNQWQQEKREASLRLEITSVREAQVQILSGALLNNTQALQENTKMLQRIENRRDWGKEQN